MSLAIKYVGLYVAGPFIGQDSERHKFGYIYGILGSMISDSCQAKVLSPNSID